jgi:hypothetical protein
VSNIYYCLTATVLFLWGALSDERTGLSFVYVAGPCQRSLSRVRVPLGLTTIFYCLRFETFLFVASYVSQGHGGGIRPHLHVGYWFPFNTYIIYTQRFSLSLYNPSARTTQKTQCLCCCEALFTEPLSSNDVLLLRMYASAGMCLPNHCLAMDLYVTVLSWNLLERTIEKNKNS